jgi:hypothetical protein
MRLTSLERQLRFEIVSFVFLLLISDFRTPDNSRAR